MLPFTRGNNKLQEDQGNQKLKFGNFRRFLTFRNSVSKKDKNFLDQGKLKKKKKKSMINMQRIQVWGMRKEKGNEPVESETLMID